MQSKKSFEALHNQEKHERFFFFFPPACVVDSRLRNMKHGLKTKLSGNVQSARCVRYETVNSSTS